jgi:arylsulfatase A-like enzyme
MIAGPGASGAERPRRPNVVFILADDLGYAHLGCYGQKIIQTPHLDRMAAEGLRFTQAYAGCCICAPSRCTLMTGYHMGHASVRANPGGVPLLPEDITVAQVLKKAGYTCGCFGKWGLGDADTDVVPNKKGFDEFFGYLHQVHAHSHYPAYLWHNDKKVFLPGNSGNSKGLTGDKRGQHSHDQVTSRALEFLRRNKDRPFFCYIPYTIPHVELLAPEEAVKPYRGKFEETPYVDKNKHYADQPTPRAVYAGMVSHLDRSVGQVLALLKELGLDEKTLVVFSSDNGAQSGVGTDPVFFNATGPLRGYKTELYEGGIRVPLIARLPGRIAAGGVSNVPCYFPDVLPTLAELAGAEPLRGIDGLSLVPTLLGEKAAGRKQPLHDFLYWENGPEKNLRQAVRMGDWKAVRNKSGAALELYNLATDVGEKQDVSGKQPEVVARIEAYLKACRTPQRLQQEPEKPAGQLFR